jgi:hypothetical protein
MNRRKKMGGKEVKTNEAILRDGRLLLRYMVAQSGDNGQSEGITITRP